MCGSKRNALHPSVQKKSVAFPDGNKQKINREPLDLFVSSRTEPHMACPSILPGSGMEEDPISTCKFTSQCQEG